VDNEFLSDISHQWDNVSDLEAYLADLIHDEPLVCYALDECEGTLTKAHKDITDAIDAVNARVNQLKLKEECNGI